jgi:hypothetical protein
MATMPNINDEPSDEPESFIERTAAECEREAIQATVEYHVDISDVDDERIEHVGEHQVVCSIASSWASEEFDMTHSVNSNDVVAQPVDRFGEEMTDAWKAVVRLDESVTSPKTADY